MTRSAAPMSAPPHPFALFSAPTRKILLHKSRVRAIFQNYSAPESWGVLLNNFHEEAPCPEVSCF